MTAVMKGYYMRSLSILLSTQLGSSNLPFPLTGLTLFISERMPEWFLVWRLQET
jgi:hypothetical protein